MYAYTVGDYFFFHLCMFPIATSVIFIPVVYRVAHALQWLRPEVTLVDLPTACGKTVWALSAMALLLSPSRWPSLCDESHASRRGTIVHAARKKKARSVMRVRF